MDSPSSIFSLNSDLLKLLVKMVSPSTYIALFWTCHFFQNFKRKLTIKEILEDASTHETLRLFKYLLESGLHHDEIEVCNIGASKGDIIFLQWARKAVPSPPGSTIKSQKQNYPWDEYTCANAAGGGHLKTLKWLHENGCPWDEWTCAFAASNGHLEILKWLHENDCPWDVSTCAGAARCGHLETLKWLKENGCPWYSNVCALAAKGGHLETLKWLRENGCPWGPWNCDCAAGGGHLEVLKWSIENGCPWDKHICLEVAEKHQHNNIIEYIKSL